MGGIHLVGHFGPPGGEALLLRLGAADLLAETRGAGAGARDLLLQFGDARVSGRDLREGFVPALDLTIHGCRVDLLPREIGDLLEGAAAVVERVERGGRLIDGGLRPVEVTADGRDLVAELREPHPAGEPEDALTDRTAVRPAGALARLTGDREREAVLRQLAGGIHADERELLLEPVLQPAGEGGGAVVEAPGERRGVEARALGETGRHALEPQTLRQAHAVDRGAEGCQVRGVDQDRRRETAEGERERPAPRLELGADVDELGDERQLGRGETRRLRQRRARLV
ncbi:hypothetical protein [Microbacterium sp. IEGM 1404]|uniref:hypothetical protein n=1 Tax=Microbacterium sp. IEGM 1404 TaxID=3047084 RepID=UPI0024B861ED|nr:hypothetical protein [Microbacterium sp. IEGM 1404]MDI9892869.1 hypothetical protein [Microbacterium sp. IEGM 1404]